VYMKKKYLIIVLSVICIIGIYMNYKMSNPYPEVTNTSFKIKINEKYDIIQTSATTCDFVRDADIHQLNILVRRVDRVNWNEKFVILENLDHKYYIYNLKNNELFSYTNENNFEIAKHKYNIDLNLKNKKYFDRVPINN